MAKVLCFGSLNIDNGQGQEKDAFSHGPFFCLYIGCSQFVHAPCFLLHTVSDNCIIEKEKAWGQQANPSQCSMLDQEWKMSRNKEAAPWTDGSKKHGKRFFRPSAGF